MRRIALIAALLMSFAGSAQAGWGISFHEDFHGHGHYHDHGHYHYARPHYHGHYHSRPYVVEEYHAYPAPHYHHYPVRPYPAHRHGPSLWIGF